MVGAMRAAATRPPAVPDELLDSVAAAAQEVISCHEVMTPAQFVGYAPGQLLVGYLRGVAAAYGMDTQTLLDLAGPRLARPETIRSLWPHPN